MSDGDEEIAHRVELETAEGRELSLAIVVGDSRFGSTARAAGPAGGALGW